METIALFFNILDILLTVVIVGFMPVFLVAIRKSEEAQEIILEKGRELSEDYEGYNYLGIMVIAVAAVALWFLMPYSVIASFFSYVIIYNIMTYTYRKYKEIQV